MPLLLVLSFIYSAGILTKVNEELCMVWLVCYVCVGTCDRKRNKVEGVHEDDGTVWMDFVVYLVCQAVSVSADHSFFNGYINKGMWCMSVII